MKSKKINIVRLLCCSLVLCMLVCGMLAFYVKGTDKVTEFCAKVNEDNGGSMANTLWLAEKIFYVLPVCVLALIQTLFYKTQKSADKKVRHSECSLEFFIAFAFTYMVLLPFVLQYSKQNPTTVDPETGEEILSLATRTVQWFMWQFLFFLIPIIYHRSANDEALLPKSDTESAEVDSADEIDCENENRSIEN